MKKFILFFVAMLIQISIGYSQCANTSNIYSFNYNGHTYQVVKENKTWTESSICSVELNGYLLEINDEAEQDAIFLEVITNADIGINNTENQFGTAAVWIGGHDSNNEGTWIWDGDNDGAGINFWEGGVNGNPVGGAYTNWGVSPPEPDNSGGQDKLTLTIETTHPNFSLWNDLAENNSLYFIIEHNELLSNEDTDLKNKIRIFPNPVSDYFRIENNSQLKINKIFIFNDIGQLVREIEYNSQANKIDITNLNSGVYNLKFIVGNNHIINFRLLK